MAQQPSPQVAQALAAVSQKYNVPLWFLYSVAARESSFDPRAVNDWDSEAGSGWPGRGLFQITGQDSANPQFAAYGNARNDLGFNRFGQWVDPKTVPYMSDIFDPYQNAERFAAGHAVPWYNYMKSQHPNWSNDQLWDAVAFNWNKGYFAAYDPNETRYMGQYRDYAKEYARQLGGGYTGDPRTQQAGQSGYGPSAGAIGSTSRLLGQDLFPSMTQLARQPTLGQNVFTSRYGPSTGAGLTAASFLGQQPMPTALGQSIARPMFGGGFFGQNTLGMRSPLSFGSFGQSTAPGMRPGNMASAWLEYYNRVYGR